IRADRSPPRWRYRRGNRRVRFGRSRLLGAPASDDQLRPKGARHDGRSPCRRRDRLLPARLRIAAFGAGPLLVAGVTMPMIYAAAAIVALAMGMASFAVTRAAPVSPLVGAD